MSGLIGVGDERSLRRLKRWLLLVDHVAVVHGDSDWEFRKKDPRLAADLDWLCDPKGYRYFLATQCGPLLVQCLNPLKQHPWKESLNFERTPQQNISSWL